MVLTCLSKPRILVVDFKTDFTVKVWRKSRDTHTLLYFIPALLFLISKIKVHSLYLPPEKQMLVGQVGAIVEQ